MNILAAVRPHSLKELRVRLLYDGELEWALQTACSGMTCRVGHVISDSESCLVLRTHRCHTSASEWLTTRRRLCRKINGSQLIL